MLQQWYQLWECELPTQLIVDVNKEVEKTKSRAICSVFMGGQVEEVSSEVQHCLLSLDPRRHLGHSHIHFSRTLENGRCGGSIFFRPPCLVFAQASVTETEVKPGGKRFLKRGQLSQEGHFKKRQRDETFQNPLYSHKIAGHSKGDKKVKHFKTFPAITVLKFLGSQSYSVL